MANTKATAGAIKHPTMMERKPTPKSIEGQYISKQEQEP
jgi:hypothetical protein